MATKKMPQSDLKLFFFFLQPGREISPFDNDIMNLKVQITVLCFFYQFFSISCFINAYVKCESVEIKLNSKN